MGIVVRCSRVAAGCLRGAASRTGLAAWLEIGVTGVVHKRYDKNVPLLAAVGLDHRLSWEAFKYGGTANWTLPRYHRQPAKRPPRPTPEQRRWHPLSLMWAELWHECGGFTTNDLQEPADAASKKHLGESAKILRQISVRAGVKCVPFSEHRLTSYSCQLFVMHTLCRITLECRV